MRIFNQSGKTNFVDTNDILVGFDTYQCCCEDFGYFFAITSGEMAKEIDPPLNLEDLVFDPDFFKEHPGSDQGGVAVFRLFLPRRFRVDQEMREMERELKSNGGCEEVFLHLYNHHNGYYSHGFSMTHGDIKIQSGSI